jgi:hypothetical protein
MFECVYVYTHRVDLLYIRDVQSNQEQAQGPSYVRTAAGDAAPYHTVLPSHANGISRPAAGSGHVASCCEI